MILSYARVSTKDQADEHATSLPEQRRRNFAIATLRGASRFDFAHFEDAGVSGAVPLARRPAGGEMLRSAKAGDVIVANKLDRLFRSASDALVTADALGKEKIDLVLTDIGSDPVTANGAARLFFCILASVAEFERERIAERTEYGRQEKKKKGGHIGGVAPFGFRVVGSGRVARLEPDVEEQDVIRLAVVLSRRRDLRGPWHAARTLNELGVRSRTGKPLQTVQVQRWLERTS